MKQKYDFYNNCVRGYGSRQGNDIYEAISRAFDRMPISAIIDNSIFCANSGVPTSRMDVHEFKSIPCPLEEPSSRPEVWEMLYNVPIGNEAYELLKEQGKHISKKDDGHYFSDEHINKFLSTNQLSHIITSHFVSSSSYIFIAGGKLLNIFSASHFSGKDNDASCAYIDAGKIRVILIDSDNKT